MLLQEAELHLKHGFPKNSGDSIEKVTFIKTKFAHCEMILYLLTAPNMVIFINILYKLDSDFLQ